MIEILKYEDICQYKNLIDQCFGESNEIDFYRRYKENNNYTIIVYKKDNIIVGSVTFYKIDLFTFSFQPCLEIFNVAVLPSYRSQGIAKTLLNYVLEYGKKNEYNQIFLTCLDSAYEAHRLYESIGFKRVNSTKFSLSIKEKIKGVD